MDAAAIAYMNEHILAPWVRELGLRIEHLEPHYGRFTMPENTILCRDGGVVSGQAVMAAADTCFAYTVSAETGQFVPMTTAYLNTHFLRALKRGDIRIEAKVVKAGSRLVMGQVEFFQGEEQQVAALSTVTFVRL